MIVKNGNYICAVSRDGMTAELREVIANKPTAESGYDYRLKTDLTWELVEVPVIDDPEDEATVEDYEEALGRFGL